MQSVLRGWQEANQALHSLLEEGKIDLCSARCDGGWRFVAGSQVPGDRLGTQLIARLCCRALGDIGNTLSSTFNNGCNVGKDGLGKKVRIATAADHVLCSTCISARQSDCLRTPTNFSTVSPMEWERQALPRLLRIAHPPHLPNYNLKRLPCK